MSNRTKIMTVMAAVFAVAMMIAVPILTAVDTDANLKSGSEGLCSTADDPNDEELVTYHFDNKKELLTESSTGFLKIFNLAGPFGQPTVTAGDFSVKEYYGLNLDTDKIENIDGLEVSGKEVRIEYVATDTGYLMKDSFFETDYEEAVNAIKAYFKNDVSVGDKLTITGTVKVKEATKTDVDYGAVNDNVCVVKKNAETYYCLYDIDVDIVFTHDGDSKSIGFRSSQRFEYDITTTYDYKKELSDLTIGDKCTVSYKNIRDYESGSSCYKVNGKEKDVDICMVVPLGPDDPDVLVTFYLYETLQSFFDSFKSNVEKYPASSGNVTVEKGYDEAKSAYSTLGAEVMVDDLLGIVILIAVGVGALILILIVVIVIVFVVKKKKQNQ